MLSLPDWAFYPISTAAAAGMIAAALSFGESTHRTPEEILAEGIVFEGDALASLTIGNGLTAEFLRGSDKPFMRIQAARGPLDGPQSAGAFLALTPDQVNALQGRRLSIRYTVRSSDTEGASHVQLNMFVTGRGQSGWETHSLEDSFEVIALEIAPPQCDWQFGYIGLWPSWTPGQNQVDLERVELTALEALDC